MKVAINRHFGGFRLSKEACDWLIKNKGWRITEWGDDGEPKDEDAELVLSTSSSFSKRMIARGQTDKAGVEDFLGKYCVVGDDDKPAFRTRPDVIECVEALGGKASGTVASIEIIEIPDDIKWHIEEYDGLEHIAEDHRTWP